MTELPTIADMVGELRRLTGQVEQAMGKVFELAQLLPEVDRDYERSFSSALLDSDGGSSDRRKAEATLASLEQREAKQKAEYAHQAHRQYVSVLQTAISAVQSIANALRSELDLAGKGPR